jgi:hypothetical protein
VIVLKISQFWRAFAAGKPLGRAWLRKDAQIALENLDLIDELPMPDWLRIGDVERLALLRQSLALEAA